MVFHQVASRFMPANPALSLEGSKLPVNLAETPVAVSSRPFVDRRIFRMLLSSLLTLGTTGESRDCKIENMFLIHSLIALVLVVVFLFSVSFSCFSRVYPFSSHVPQFLLVSLKEFFHSNLSNTIYFGSFRGIHIMP